jgi:hypothetical protein
MGSNQPREIGGIIETEDRQHPRAVGGEGSHFRDILGAGSQDHKQHPQPKILAAEPVKHVKLVREHRGVRNVDFNRHQNPEILPVPDRDIGLHERAFQPQRLIQRGEIAFYFDALHSWTNELVEMNANKRGGPYCYPNSLIFIAKMLRFQFSIDYRSLEGILRSIGKWLGFEVPNYSTLYSRLGGLDAT